MDLERARTDLDQAGEKAREALTSAKQNLTRSAAAAKTRLEPIAEAARRSAEQVQEVGDLTRRRLERMTGKQKAGAVLAAGTVAGALAWWALRHRDRSLRSRLRLEPTSDGRWRIVSEGFDLAELTDEELVFETKRKGLRAARALARDLAGRQDESELIVHLADGAEQDRHRYTA